MWKDKRFSDTPLASLVAGQTGEKALTSSLDGTVDPQQKEKKHTSMKCSLQLLIDKCKIEQYEKTNTQVSILLSS